MKNGSNFGNASTSMSQRNPLYIIADGPSFRSVDQKCISGDVWVVPQLLDYPMKVKIDYCSLAEATHAILDRHRATLESYPCEKVFTPFRGEAQRGISGWTHFYKDDRKLQVRDERKLWPFDGTDMYIATGCSLLSSALQPAIYLGYTRIYFLGMDFDSPTRLSGEPRELHHNKDSLGREAFNLAIEIAHANGIEIKDLTLWLSY